MFWALYGDTRTPRRAKARHRPVVTTLFPASDVVPATSSDPLTGVRLARELPRDDARGGFG
jgi:hypothetical protein